MITLSNHRKRHFHFSLLPRLVIFLQGCRKQLMALAWEQPEHRRVHSWDQDLFLLNLRLQLENISLLTPSTSQVSPVQSLNLQGGEADSKRQRHQVWSWEQSRKVSKLVLALATERHKSSTLGSLAGVKLSFQPSGTRARNKPLVGWGWCREHHNLLAVSWGALHRQHS